MKWLVSSACVFSVLLFTVYAAPASTGLQVSAGGQSGQSGLTNIISNIDLPGLLQGLNSVVKLIGVVCPPLSQVLDNVIQNVTSTAFRVFGRIILRSNGLGGAGGSNGGGGGGEQTVNVVLPTFPPDDDEDYDDDGDDASDSSKTTTQKLAAVTENASPLAENDVSSNAISKRHVRVIREAAAAEADAESEVETDEDQDGAESAPEPNQHLGDAAAADDQDRNKRFLPFGGGDAHGAHGGAGSGNFLFDIIRNTADRAARAVGTVYRMVAGTDNEGGAWSFAVSSIPKATKTLSTASSSLSASILPSKLVAGSGASEESDEHDGGAGPGGIAEIDVQKTADGYTEGIPGPITRLFVLANRGIANLIQDLILRLAQTSERLVNFKARLITSLI